MRRRNFLIQLTLLALTGSRCISQAVANWRGEDFSSGDFEAKWNALTSADAVIDTREISLTLPAIAENGAVVPVIIRSELENLQRLYLWVEQNPTPLAAIFELSPFIDVHLHARIKMAQSCKVHVLARQGERWLHCQQWVQVMVGGCGTG